VIMDDNRNQNIGSKLDLLINMLLSFKFASVAQILAPKMRQ
jgi:hypothetical protein